MTIRSSSRFPPRQESSISLAGQGIGAAPCRSTPRLRRSPAMGSPERSRSPLRSRLDRTLAIQRFDYNPAAARTSRWLASWAPLWPSPISSGPPTRRSSPRCTRTPVALGLTGTHSFRPNLTNEIRAGYSRDDLHWNRPHSEIPTLVSEDGVTLPGSPAFYGYRNINGTTEFLDNVIWARGRIC